MADDILLPMPGNLRYSVQRDGRAIVFRMFKESEYAAIEWVDRFAKEMHDPANGALTLSTRMTPGRISLLVDIDTPPMCVVPPAGFWRGVYSGCKRAFFWPLPLTDDVTIVVVMFMLVSIAFAFGRVIH